MFIQHKVRIVAKLHLRKLASRLFFAQDYVRYRKVRPRVWRARASSDSYSGLRSLRIDLLVLCLALPTTLIAILALTFDLPYNDVVGRLRPINLVYNLRRVLFRRREHVSTLTYLLRLLLVARPPVGPQHGRLTFVLNASVRYHRCGGL